MIKETLAETNSTIMYLIIACVILLMCLIGLSFAVGVLYQKKQKNIEHVQVHPAGAIVGEQPSQQEMMQHRGS